MTLEDGLLELRSHLFLHNNITELRLTTGSYTAANSGSSTGTLAASLLNFNSLMFANSGCPTCVQVPSELKVTGEGAVLYGSLAPAELNGTLFTIGLGLPGLTTFSGITFEEFGHGAAPAHVFKVDGSAAMLEGCDFHNNTGGAVHVTQGSLILRDGLLTDNGHENAYGGAIKIEGGALEVDNITFTGNVALEGGAIYANAGNLTIRRSRFSLNVAQTGGALAVDGRTDGFNWTSTRPKPDVFLTDGSSLAVDNMASNGKAAYLYPTGDGAITYLLPAPIAHWVAATECKFYDLPAGVPQPCEPREYGSWRARFSAGASDDGIPYECAAGKLGETFNPAEQASSSCSRPCPAGNYCPAASAVPIPCRMGTYCSTASPYESPCMQGTWGSRMMLTSQEQCTTCAPGWWCQSGNRIACGVGSYNPFPSQYSKQSCQQCPTFSTTNASAASSLSQCQCLAGFERVDDDVLPGAASSSFSCYCDRGKGFIGSSTEGRCEICNYGTYKDSLSNDECSACPYEHSTTASVGAGSIYDCLCEPGFYMWDNLLTGTRRCMDCPTGTNCSTLGVTLDSLPLVKDFYRQPKHNLTVVVDEDSDSVGDFGSGDLSDSSGRRRLTSHAERSVIIFSHTARPCPIPDVCLGGTDPDNQCEVGHTGPLCAVCDTRGPETYYGGNPKKGKPCLLCEGDPTLTVAVGAGFIGLVMLTAVFLLITGKWRKVLAFMMTLNINFKVQRGAKKVKLAVKKDKKRKASCLARLVNYIVGMVMYVLGTIKRQQAKMKILVSLLQVMNGMGATFELPYPPAVSNAVSVSQYFELDVAGFMPMQCIFPWINYCHKIIFQTAYPWIFIGFFRFCSKRLKAGADSTEGGLIKGKIQRLKPKQIEEGQHDPWEDVDGFRRVADLFDDLAFFLLFLLYPGASAAIFSYFVCDTFDGLGETGGRFLQADLSVDCDGATYYAVLPYVLAMIVVYPIGTPCIFYAILFQNRDLLEEMQRTELLAASTKESIKVMEEFVLHHEGEEMLEEFRNRQSKIAAGAIKRFASIKMSSRSTEEIRDSIREKEEQFEESAQERDAKWKSEIDLRLSKSFEETSITSLQSGRSVDDIVKRAILKLQANTRGKKVRNRQRLDEMAIEQATKDNRRLFDQKYAEIDKEIESARVLDKRLADLALTMPSTVQKLVIGYEYRVYWFEIFECWRKLALTCLPQLLEPGVNQLTMGLLIAFATFAMYVGFAPYDDDANDQLSIVCQSIVFFSILSGIVMQCGTESTLVDILLPLTILLPLSYVLIVKTGCDALYRKLKNFLARKGGAGWKKRAIAWLDRQLGTPVNFATATMQVHSPEEPKIRESRARVEPTKEAITESTTSAEEESTVLPASKPLPHPTLPQAAMLQPEPVVAPVAASKAVPAGTPKPSPEPPDSHRSPEPLASNRSWVGNLLGTPALATNRSGSSTNRGGGTPQETDRSAPPPTDRSAPPPTDRSAPPTDRSNPSTDRSQSVPLANLPTIKDSASDPFTPTGGMGA